MDLYIRVTKKYWGGYFRIYGLSDEYRERGDANTSVAKY